MVHFSCRPWILACAAVCGSLPMAWAGEAAVLNRASQTIPGHYIIRFKPTVDNPEAQGRLVAAQAGGQVIHIYRHALQGVSVRVPAHMAATLEQALRHNPNVLSFEPDSTVHAVETQLLPPVTQSNATWGLDRLDQRDRPLNGSYQYQYTGQGVYAFVIDTGILATHTEFTGRLQPGYTAIADGNGSNDCHGHGTHVAGTVGGRTWGVAKNATLVPVRVLDCTGSGSNSGVIAGIDWVAGQTTLRPAVANLSLGGSKSSTLNAAVASAVSQGVTMVVAAGNSNANACNYSPASEPAAITVGATDSTDTRASYSNYGTCLDLFAPGSAITSAYYTSNTASATMSGTSMASPHVAGVAVLALSANPAASTAAVARFVLDNASPNKVSTAGTGSPNKLAFSMASGAPAEAVLTTVRVTALSGSSARINAQYWRAYANVTVRDLNGNAVPSATITGTFSGGGTPSCVTGSTGSCQLSSNNLSNRNVLSTTFTVSNVTGSNLRYDATQNTVSSITISRP